MDTQTNQPTNQSTFDGGNNHAELPESLWQAKPWWCQPWSIVLTGFAIPIGSWLLLHRLWITLPVASVIIVWWVLFLGIVPAQYAASVEDFRAQAMPKK